MICVMCSNLLKEPKILLCAHSFCKDCLVTNLKMSCKSPSTGMQYEMDSDESDKEENCDDRIECPVCLQTTLLPDEHSIDSLETHTELKEAIERLSPQQKQVIRDKKVLQLKLISDLTEGNEGLQLEMCEIHSKKNEYFCIDCSAIACVKCVAASP